MFIKDETVFLKKHLPMKPYLEIGNKLIHLLPLTAFILFLFSCSGDHGPIMITSVEGSLWQEGTVGSASAAENKHLNTYVVTDEYEQVIDGFGAVFNELGWDALQMVTPGERERILTEFFSEEGFNFSICRMPIGANDYARDWYSLNDTPGDLAMEHFSIGRDREILIPYIQSALAIRPDLKIWGSPWCPPAWMKVNNHYACRPAPVNDLPEDGAGRENVTQFIMEDDYLDAYARYFVRYIEAYREEGIDIYAVHVQNEPNSCQNFPSCIWTAHDLNIFIGQHLGPAFDQAVPGTEIWYGTIERPAVEKVDTVLQDPLSSKYIDGVGFQWAGKQCIPLVNGKYPGMKLMQTESECGDGSNDWQAAEYTWGLIRHYLENGANAYMYWNTILDETGKSMWGWKQNSLISVESGTGKVTRNPEFYLFRHLTHFVQPGAIKRKTPEGFNSGMFFENPDGSVVGLLVNETDSVRQFVIECDGKAWPFTLDPHSFNTVTF